MNITGTFDYPGTDTFLEYISQMKPRKGSVPTCPTIAHKGEDYDPGHRHWYRLMVLIEESTMVASKASFLIPVPGVAELCRK
jgi:hypothetical protein